MAVFRLLFNAVIIEGLAIAAVIWFVASPISNAESSTVSNNRSMVGNVDDVVGQLSSALSEPVPPLSQRTPYVSTTLESAAKNFSGAAHRLIESTIDDVFD